MKFAVFLLLVCCFLPALTTARNSGGKKNEVLRQETAAAGAGTNIINTITNLLSSLPSSLGVLLLLPLLPLLLILSGAGPLFSSLTNSGLGNLGALGAGAAGLPNLLAGTGATAAAAAANPGFYYREQRSANADGGTSFWDILTTVDNALKKYEVSDRECQLRLTCEVHRQGLSSSTGSFAEKLVQAFGIESRIAKSSFGKSTKKAMNDFFKAARYGMAHKDCASIYFRCTEYQN